MNIVRLHILTWIHISILNLEFTDLDPGGQLILDPQHCTYFTAGIGMIRPQLIGPLDPDP